MGFLCVTVDLDEISCYHAIHGLPKPEGEGAHAVYGRALHRFARFVEEQQIPSTLFAVGEAVERGGEAAAMLGHLAGRGHELGNHTMSHRYDLTLLSSREQEAEIDRAADAIRGASGTTPRGFRAPGYNMSLGLASALAERGYLYDSSVFPCPIYYSARAAAIGLKSLRGSRSASLVGDPRVLTAPLAPYRIGEEGLWTAGSGLVELPIGVVTSARLPLLGTFLALSGKTLARILAKAAATLPLVNLELHGIDFSDPEADGIADLAAYQPELRVSLARRLAVFEAFIKTLLDAGLEPLTLADAAERSFL